MLFLKRGGVKVSESRLNQAAAKKAKVVISQNELDMAVTFEQASIFEGTTQTYDFTKVTVSGPGGSGGGGLRGVIRSS